MQYRPELPRPSSPGGIIGRAAAAVGAAVVFIAAFFLGFVVLAVVVGIAAIAGLALWLRLWWFSRQMRRQFAQDGPRAGKPGQAPTGDTVEGEFIVIREDSNQRDR